MTGCKTVSNLERKTTGIKRDFLPNVFHIVRMKHPETWRGPFTISRYNTSTIEKMKSYDNSLH